MIIGGGISIQGGVSFQQEVAAAPAADFTATITVGGPDPGSSYGYGATVGGGTKVGSISNESPAGVLSGAAGFIMANQYVTNIQFNQGTFGSLTIGYGNINGHTSLSVTVGGITQTFTFDIMGQLHTTSDVFNIQARLGQSLPVSITLL